jgi:hypothetical protein
MARRGTAGPRAGRSRTPDESSSNDMIAKLRVALAASLLVAAVAPAFALS